MRLQLPTEAQVRAAAAELLETVGGGRPTATALATRVGISRPALYRHYRPLVDELLEAAAEQAAAGKRPARSTTTCGHEDDLARLRRTNEELRRHVQIYEEVIRQLTVDNHSLKQQLASRAGVTDLVARRHRSYPEGS
jgi:AcrR family transcriptional regulator